MEQVYASTSHISEYLDIGADWLREHKRDVFTEGIHYFHPRGFKDTRWDKDAMTMWMRGDDVPNNEANIILNSLSS